MSFRRTFGSIIIFFGVIGLLINIGLLGFGFVSCSLNMPFISGTDCTNFGELIIQGSVGLIGSLITIGIGFLIRGRSD